MRKPLAAIAGVLMIVGAVFAVTVGATAASAAQTYPHIHKAYRLLSRAHYVIGLGCTRLGGHRVSALKQVDMAINELKLASAAVQVSLPQISESGTPMVGAGQIHPFMQDALSQCRRAKAELQAAAHDFGGHRVKAIEHIDAAVAQLQQALNEPPCH